MRIPLHTAVVELLAKNPGGLTDREIFEKLKEQYEELNFNHLMKTLLKLEVNGVVRVTRYQKDTMKVELLTE